MKSGIDPTRRNRNIGTERAGHGADNRHGIPQSWHDNRVYWEKLSDPVLVERRLQSRPVTFFIEPTRPDCVHACTVDDVMRVLQLLPPENQLCVTTFVFRQPTRRQSQLRPVWGRWSYFAKLGRYRGPAIYLDAQAPDRSIRWEKSLDPFDQRELERLRDDGHEIATLKRHHEIRPCLPTLRNTQLFRTLPHEIGHHVQWQGDVATGREYWARPEDEREQFAHRFAGEVSHRATMKNLIPFPRQLSLRTLSKDGLRPGWFGL